MLKKGKPVPGWKMVPKRATRSWVNEDNAKAALLGSLKESEVMVSKLISPAAAEKLLKKLQRLLKKLQRLLKMLQKMH
jgi:hypothetical protein